MEFCEGGEVMVKAMKDDLGMGLVELGESCGFVQEVQEEVAALWCVTSCAYVCKNHYLLVGFAKTRLRVHKGREVNGMEWNDHKGMEWNEMYLSKGKELNRIK